MEFCNILITVFIKHHNQKVIESNRLVWCSGNWSVCLWLLRLYRCETVVGGGNSLWSTWFGLFISLLKAVRLHQNTRLQTSRFCQSIQASNIMTVITQ